MGGDHLALQLEERIIRGDDLDLVLDIETFICLARLRERGFHVLPNGVDLDARECLLHNINDYVQDQTTVTHDQFCKLIATARKEYLKSNDAIAECSTPAIQLELT